MWFELSDGTEIDLSQVEAIEKTKEGGAFRVIMRCGNVFTVSPETRDRIRAALKAMAPASDFGRPVVYKPGFNERPAVFKAWGVSSEDGSSAPVAVVEYPDGRIDYGYARHIRFTDRGES
jgi:hypothetical protein